ncbi:MAG: DUF1003 domain-containing protein [Alphaproteobacteria bacterium]|nr:DUF1003 domain-containing protein [Alphaproteobacteria bacterium]
MDIRENLSRDLLNCAYADLSAQKKSVIDLIADERPSGVGPELVDQRTYWQRLADRVAQIGGSWSFIAAFGVVLALWVGSNMVLTLFHRAFDPYPFIFLNLMLSMLAAVQAPVIMMSQNRQAAIDRKAAEHDYVINLRAELEIMLLHDKLDELREHQIMARTDAIRTQLDALRADMAAIKKSIGC